MELADQGDVDVVSRSLLCNSWAIRHILNKLRNLGVNVDEYRGKPGLEKLREFKRERLERQGSFQSQGHVKRLKCLQDKEDDIANSVVDEKGEVVPKAQQVPTKYWHIEDMTATFLSQKVLPTLELASCSEANVKFALMRRGQAEYAQRIMLEAVEFMTGLSRRFALAKQMRILARFQAELSARNEARGRRGMDIRFPPDWRTMGLHLVSVTGRDVMISHRCSNKKVEVHGEPAMPSWECAESLYVDDNYSETFATLRSRDDDQESGILLRPLFPDQAKTQPLRITDA